VGWIDCPETQGRNYHYKPSNIPEECRSHKKFLELNDRRYGVVGCSADVNKLSGCIKDGEFLDWPRN
jgi:hypothetical protein